MFRIIWNLLLVCLGIAILWLVVPKVFPQFREISPTLPGTFRARAIMVGFQGIGLIVTALLLFGSLSSWAWQGISSIGRWFYGLMSLLRLGLAGILEDFLRPYVSLSLTRVWDQYSFYCHGIRRTR